MYPIIVILYGYKWFRIFLKKNHGSIKLSIVDSFWGDRINPVSPMSAPSCGGRWGEILTIMVEACQLANI